MLERGSAVVVRACRAMHAMILVSTGRLAIDSRLVHSLTDSPLLLVSDRYLVHFRFF